jgi:hypothetical protein
MVYNTQIYWVFGLCPSSGILKNTGEHNVSETGSVYVLRWGRETSTQLGPLERANLNHWTTYFHLLFLVSGLCMIYHNFYRTSLIGIAVVILTQVVHWLRLALSNGPNRVGVSPPHLRTETYPVSETLCSLVLFRIPDDGQSPKTQ